MLTYGYRQGVVNSTKTLKHTFDGAKVTIQGAGTFDNTKIIKGYAYRAVDKAMSTATVTIPAASAIGIGATEKSIGLTFDISTKSFSYDAENASDVIGHGHRYPIGIAVDGSDTGAIIAGKIRAAYQNFKGAFTGKNHMPFTVTGATDKVIFTGNDAVIYFDEQGIIEVDKYDYPTKCTTVFAMGTEGLNLGLQLESNVKMDTAASNSQFNVSPNEVPDITAKYSEISFDISTPVANNGWAHHEDLLGGVNPGGNSPASTQHFVFYYKEGGDLFAGDGTVDQMIQWLLGSGNVTAANVIKADDTAVTGADAAAQADAFIA